MLDVFFSMLDLNVRTLIAVLFWGNLTSVLMLLAYEVTSGSQLDRKLFRYFLLAKLAQTLAFFFLFQRGEIPNLLSVNLGNSLLITGFYLEALSIFTLINERNRLIRTMVNVLLPLSLLAFNLVELFHPESSIRVLTSSICVFVVLVIPALCLITSSAATVFKRIVGIFYIVFLSLLLPRAFYAFTTSLALLTNSFVQSLTFISLVMLMVFGLTAYLLLMKERADKVINTMATTDNLTGLANRHSFLEAAELRFERCRTGNLSLALLFIDIDDFKSINDTHGHIFGDDVLRSLGGSISRSLRTGDLSCRYGGEEFLILLSNVDESVAARVARRIQEDVAATGFPEKPGFGFTLSIGITCCVPGPDDKLMKYIERADDAMYQAKQAGKDRIAVYRTDLPSNPPGSRS